MININEFLKYETKGKIQSEEEFIKLYKENKNLRHIAIKINKIKKSNRKELSSTIKDFSSRYIKLDNTHIKDNITNEVHSIKRQNKKEAMNTLKYPSGKQYKKLRRYNKWLKKQENLKTGSLPLENGQLQDQKPQNLI